MRSKLLFLFVALALLAAMLLGASPAPLQGVASVSVGSAPEAQTSSMFKLSLLYTSENHGHWEPITVSNVSQAGIARRATLVKKLRAEIPNTLLLDSGDISQGTLYFVQYKSQEGRDLYNLLGYDAVTPGNHEFDLGPKVFADNFVTGAKFSIVNTNVDFSGEPILAGKLPPYVIKEIGGQKVGIFGMITDDLPINSNAGPNIKMKDAMQTAKDMVAEFKKQGINKVILLSHRGYPADLALASKVDGIDVIVGGHTETLLGDPDKLDKSLGTPIAPNPMVLITPNGDRTIIVHDFIWGRTLGRLDLTFDENGDVTNWGGGLIFVDKNIEEDKEVAAKLATLGNPLNDLKQQIVGKTSVDLDGERATARNKESNLGDLIADAMVWATASDKTQIAITNGGGIRTSIKTGAISYGNILEVLPFGNRIVQFDLLGADVLAALENGVSTVVASGDSGGRFPQVSGIKFAVDFNKPVGSRVSEVQVGNDKTGWKLLDKATTYRIATNDFMSTGGDGYAMFKNGKNPNGGDVPLDQALTDYIKFLNVPVAAKVEGRITITGTPPAAPATPTPAATAVPVVTPVSVATPTGKSYP